MSVEEQLAQLRIPLLRYANMQLRCEAMAEDVVSETLLAILEKPDAYAGSSSLRTYAIGILKHKVVDALRRRGRELAVEPIDEQSIDEAIDALFKEDGHWTERPRSRAGVRAARRCRGCSATTSTRCCPTRSASGCGCTSSSARRAATSSSSSR